MNLNNTLQNTNYWYKNAFETDHARKPVFLEVLSELNNQPVNILEIGATGGDMSDKNYIHGAGGSSFYFAEYVRQNGGSLTIVELNPQTLENCKVMLEDFVKAGVNIEFVCDDGLNWASKPYDLYYLDGSDIEWQTYEMFRKIDLRNGCILLDDWNDGGKCTRVKTFYPFFSKVYACGPTHQMGYYSKMENYGEEKFQIGSLEIPYYRGWMGNREATNNRACEIALVNWFRQKYNDDIIEIGDVSCHHPGYNGHKILDPFGPFPDAIRKDVLDYSYQNLNVVSVSTWEHLSESAYGNKDKEKPIEALKKVTKEAQNYLITFDIGADRYLEDWLMNQDEIKYTFMVRENSRGLVNNWTQSNDKNNFYLEYGHFEYKKNLYGNALAICVIGNLPEIFT